MTNSRVVPVGRRNQTVFVRTDLVASMEIISRPDGRGGVDRYELVVYMQGSRGQGILDGYRAHRIEFDFKSEATEAACTLMNKINGVDS